MRGGRGVAIAVALIAAAAFALVAGSAPARPHDEDATSKVLLPPKHGRVYHGANPGFGGSEDVVSGKRIRGFEQLAHHKIAWAYFSNNWLHGKINFPAARIKRIYRAGTVPFVRLMPRSSFRVGRPDRHFTMQSIIDGAWDGPTEGSDGLRSWCRQAAELDRPLLAEFGTEVDGDWFPWNGRYNGGARTDGYGDPDLADGPERFVDAYRHIIALCRAQGATNVTWFFHADADPKPAVPWNSISAYYPGDRWVDWIGVSYYGSLSHRYGWQQLSGGLGRSMPELERLAAPDDKPLALIEFGTREDRSRPGRKASWIEQAGRDLRERWPQLDAVSWWNESYPDHGERIDLRIDSSRSALRAYRDVFARRHYATRLASAPAMAKRPSQNPRAPG